MKKVTEILISLLILAGIVGATALVGHASMVSPKTVLSVIQK